MIIIIISVSVWRQEMSCLHSPLAQDHTILMNQPDEAKGCSPWNHGFQAVGNQAWSKPAIVPGVPHLINECLATVGHFDVQLRLQGMHGVFACTDSQALKLQHILRPAPVELIPMFHHTSNQLGVSGTLECRLAGILILLVHHKLGDLKLGSVRLRDVLTTRMQKIWAMVPSNCFAQLDEFWDLVYFWNGDGILAASVWCVRDVYLKDQKREKIAKYQSFFPCLPAPRKKKAMEIRKRCKRKHVSSLWINGDFLK